MYAVISDLARHSGNYLHGMYKSRDDALLKAYEIGDHCWVVDVRHRDLTERPVAQCMEDKLTSEKKIPKRVMKIIDRCRMGEKLCLHLHHKNTDMCERVFNFEPSGKPAPKLSSEEAIVSGLLVPACDGLFGLDTSQTYVAA